MFVEFVMLLALASVLFWIWATKNDSFFEKRGVPYDKPAFLFGSMNGIIFKKKSLSEFSLELYNKHNGRVFGIFDQRTPVFMVRDPELIKQIAVKDFDHFINHRPNFKADENETKSTNLFGRSIFAMENNTWRDMRSTLSPAFTGSKMRHMFLLINQVAESAIKHIKEQPGADTSKGVEIEMKDFSTRFTNDVIASAAFGLEVDSRKQKDNEFYQMGKRVTNFTAWQNLKFFLFTNFKTIMEIIGMELFDRKDTDYFMRLVMDAMKYRKENNISRPDMINMLMEARGLINSESSNTVNRDWSDIDMVAQCFIFFFAGFETTSVLLCFAAYELMLNPDIQQRLYEEIAEVDRLLEGNSVTYEMLMKNVPYMDMVVSETLRKWPAAAFLDRQCNKDIVYETDGQRIQINKGDIIWFPVWGIQHDPNYYENPDKFDPERFNDENKHSRNPFNFMPFGVGPRICIGSRFALLEAKAFLYYMIRDFQIVRSPNMKLPLPLKKGTFQLTAEDGFPMNFVQRKLG